MPTDDILNRTLFARARQAREERDLQRELERQAYERDLNVRDRIAQTEDRRAAQYERMGRNPTLPKLEPSGPQLQSQDDGGISGLLAEGRDYFKSTPTPQINTTPVSPTGLEQQLLRQREQQEERNANRAELLTQDPNESGAQAPFGEGPSGLGDALSLGLAGMWNDQKKFMNEHEAAIYELKLRGNPNPSRADVDAYKASHDAEGHTPEGTTRGGGITDLQLSNDVSSYESSPATQEAADKAASSGKGLEEFLPGPSPVESAPAQKVTAWAEANKNDDETLDEFAKRVGIPMEGDAFSGEENNQAYGGWDWIRDMSAGLLASDRSNFFGALGEASVATNKKRDAADTRARKGRKDLATMKFKSDNDWDKLRFQQDELMKRAELTAASKNKAGPIYGKPMTSTVNGVKQSMMQVIANGEELDPANLVHRGPYTYLLIREDDRTADDDKHYERLVKLGQQGDEYHAATDNIGVLAEGIALGTEYNGQMIARREQSKDLQSAMAEFNEKAPENFAKIQELIDDGNYRDMLSLTQGLQLTQGTMNTLRDIDKQGVFYGLEKDEKGMLIEEARKRTQKALKSQYNRENPEYISVPGVAREAMESVLRDVKWDKKGKMMFAVDADAGTLQRGIEHTDKHTGGDRARQIFNVAGINMSEYTQYDPQAGEMIQGPFQAAGENSWINRSQYEQLPEPQKQQLDIDKATAATKLTGMGFDEERIFDDITNSIIEGNIVRGGEDAPLFFWDQQSGYHRPKTWHVEPLTFISKNGNKVDTMALRTRKDPKTGEKQPLHWDGFKGQWYSKEKDAEGKWRRHIYTPEYARETLKMKFDDIKTIDF